MRCSLLVVAAALSLSAQASWFSGSDKPSYASWDVNELRAWLDVHNVPVPKKTASQADLKELVAENWNTASAWTYDQYTSAQQSFADLRESTFDSWDDSHLRSFLLEHGVVAPKGPREQLVLLAKQKYRSFTDAASSYSSRASASASTAIYGDTKHQVTESISSAASRATEAASRASKSAARNFDHSKDYVYSTWSDNQMRTWLEEHGVLDTKEQRHKDELVQMMHDAYGSVANPIWDAWSDSYMHEWLVSHKMIKSDYEKNRDALIKPMKKYYYSATETVYSTWTDSQLKQWLIDHDIIKSEAQINREKMLKMVEDNYLHAKDTFWSAWSDNHVRDWLIEQGHMRTDAQYKRDQLIKLASEKWNDQRSKTAAYLTWPDARLRAYLREHGVGEDYLPTSRPGLLQETRIRWVQTQTRADNLIAKIKELVDSGIYKAEDVLNQMVRALSGGASDIYTNTKRASEKGYEQILEETKKMTGRQEKVAEDAKANVEEKIKTSTEKIKGEL